MESQLKSFKGKAIYTPSGKAAEYARYACNFYTGCSNECTYCYLKNGIGAKILGGNKPTLKKCFNDENHAYEVFRSELIKNLAEIKKHGLFLSFTTDPMLPETIELTFRLISTCAYLFVPTIILTKRTDWIDSGYYAALKVFGSSTAIGFTLTGRDELEPNASTNLERIEAMKKLHNAGFKTFASIEPIVDFESSFMMIKLSAPYCNLFKVGLMSGVKVDEKQLRMFIAKVKTLLYFNPPAKVYWKDSITKIVGTTMVESGFSVSRDYNLFEPLPQLS